MLYYMYIVVLSVNDYISGILKDILSVCEGIAWAVSSQLTQVNLRIIFGKRISSVCVWSILSVCIAL